MLLPPEFVAVKLMLQFPTPNVDAGLCKVLNPNHVLFPVRFFAPYAQLVGLFVELSVNSTDNGAVPDVTFAVKLATGTG